MHTVIMQGNEGPQLLTLLEYLQALGVTRVIYPGREYRSKGAGGEGAQPEGPASKAIYETARLLPRGGDGGFAESFLSARDT